MNNQEILNALNEKIKAAEEALLYLKQSKASFERVIANSKKSPAEEAFKKVFSHYPDEKDYREGIWFGFQKGFESAQNV